MSRGLNKWTRILNVCQTLLPRKTFSYYHIYPQSTEGTANVDTAGLELLRRQLFADQHLQEQLNISYQAITEQLLDIPKRQWFI